MRLALALVLATSAALAQGRPPNGPRRTDVGWHALVHCTLVPRPGERVADATIVLRDGRIADVQAGGAVPFGARVWDCTGLWVYAGFLDGHVPVDAPRPEAGSAEAHWNPLVVPARRALDGTGPDAKTREELRSLGFTAALIAPRGGALRGQAALVSIAEPDEERGRRFAVVAERVAHEVAFELSGGGEYPNSLMGSIALVRQALFDAKHGDGACKALAGDLPLLFDVNDELDALRAAKIAREHQRRCLLVGSGLEFRRLAAIREDGCRIVLPLAFPEPPNVKSIADAEWTSLKELMTWEQAPTNPRRLAAAGLHLALTSDKLKQRSSFWPNLRKAIAHGLPEDKALALLTSDAARMFGAEAALGSVERGRLASLVVTDGPIFAETTKVRDVWVEGKRFEVTAPPQPFGGTWASTFEPPLAREATLEIDAAGQVALVVGGKRHAARECKPSESRLDFLVDGTPDADSLGERGVYAFNASFEGDRIAGIAAAPGGQRFAWSARRTAPAKPESRPASGLARLEEDAATTPEALPLPFGPYGHLPAPAPRDVVLRDATLWTETDLGIVEGGTLVVRDGKVVYAGPAATAPDTSGLEVIDARKKHVTPGLIDCHSHTGISRGVNESGQAVTAEVRIEDVIDPDAIGFYRELAGGLVACNQLHGSANPIGGQNSIVKLRWGVLRPEQMRLAGAAPGIKFALGENVKGSNATERGTRYPQTRMGVEALIKDRFVAAREYTQRQFVDPAGTRVDLELEALAEVLSGKRLVHCHSYRQDEIAMLCRVAREFGFKIGTFQHVLEGYKVTAEIKQQALGASAFSDWWAYKVEAYDAIPDNGALMRAAGINVSFNSDSDELARRLNTEAAKAVRHGGVPPHDALAFVTKNPALQLGIDATSGSLAAGKDADFVIWSGDPLSGYSRCLSTWIDGREYLSIARDAELRASIESEKRRLLQKCLRGAERKKKEGKPDATPEQRPEEKPGDAMARHQRRLEEAATWRRGECGCCGTLEEEGGR